MRLDLEMIDIQTIKVALSIACVKHNGITYLDGQEVQPIVDKLNAATLPQFILDEKPIEREQ